MSLKSTRGHAAGGRELLAAAVQAKPSGSWTGKPSGGPPEDGEVHCWGDGNECATVAQAGLDSVSATVLLSPVM
jgi:hypothetical protein